MLVLILLASALPGVSQLPPTPEKIVYAQRIQGEITVDGLLNEPAWQIAEPGGGFVQRAPAEGDPANEATEFRVLYNDESLYIGVYCHSADVEGIVITDISRDFELGQDYVAVALDTFNDDSNGFYFATTPAGGLRDQQFFNEGRYVNADWDGIWHAEGRILEDGWSTEIVIPFQTLRFNRQQTQLWGFQLYRRNRGKNETTTWTQMPRRYPLTRGVPYYGKLSGLHDVEPGRNFTVKPYVRGGIEQLMSRNEGTAGNFEGGIDFKYGLTPALTMDLTVNTDFSHVEADTQQINLTRFPLFFPEKREFFLENSGLFEFGAPARNEVLLFHSRKIGLVGGNPVPILGGVRLTGRMGGNQLGLLNVQSRSEGPIPATNFTVTRFRREIGSSNVGVLFLNRQSGQPDDHNRAVGADANLIFFQNDLRFSTTLAKTFTPNRSGEDWFHRIEGEWQSGLVRALSSYVEIQKNFNPKMGFVRRPGIRLLRNEFELRPRLRPETRPGSLIQDVFLTLQSEHALRTGGTTETKFFRSQLRVAFQNGGSFETRYTQHFERILSPFKIVGEALVSSGDYRFNDSYISLSSDPSQVISGTVFYSRGGFYDGRIRTVGIDARLRQSYRLATSVAYERNSVELPSGTVTTNLPGLRARYSFNSRMSLSAFIQFNSETDQISSNVRFRFIHRPLSDIYIVYNEQRDSLQDRTDRSLTFKYTHLLNF